MCTLRPITLNNSNLRQFYLDQCDIFFSTRSSDYLTFLKSIRHGKDLNTYPRGNVTRIHPLAFTLLKLVACLCLRSYTGGA